jgi:hypothetical protein
MTRLSAFLVVTCAAALLPAQNRQPPRVQVQVQPAAPAQPPVAQPPAGAQVVQPAQVGVDQSAAAGHAYRAKELLGSTVQIDQNNRVGTIDDLVIDDQGNVDYVIVAVSDGNFVSIPWDAVQFSLQDRVARVPIAVERFKTIPTFTAERYPVFTAPSYRTQTYQFFGLTPGERRAIRRATR